MVLADDWVGPVDHLAMTLPAGPAGQEGVELLLDLVDSHQIRLLDLEVLRRDGDGLVVVEPAQIDDLDLHELEGARSGLLDDEDLATLAGELDPGVRAIVVVYEVLVVHPVVDAWRRAGAQVLAEGAVGLEDLVEALAAREEEVGG